MQDQSFKNYGAFLLADAMGADPTKLGTLQAADEHLQKEATWTTAVCGVVRDIFDLVHGEASAHSNLVREAVKQAAAGDVNATWVRDTVADVALEPLSAVAMEKVAVRGLAGLSVAGLRAGAALTPAVLKSLLAASVATGAGVGAISWGLNRDANQDDAELEQIQAQIDTYNRISREIETKLKSRGVDISRPADQEAVRQISGADRVVTKGY